MGRIAGRSVRCSRTTLWALPHVHTGRLRPPFFCFADSSGAHKAGVSAGIPVCIADGFLQGGGDTVKRAEQRRSLLGHVRWFPAVHTRGVQTGGRAGIVLPGRAGGGGQGQTAGALRMCGTHMPEEVFGGAAISRKLVAGMQSGAGGQKKNAARRRRMRLLMLSRCVQASPQRC